MTTQFRPGDRVRCIDDAGISLSTGTTYEVKTARDDLVIFVGYESWGWYSATRFKLVENEDKVTLPGRSVYERVLLIAKIHAQANAETWAKIVEQLEAIK